MPFYDAYSTVMEMLFMLVTGDDIIFLLYINSDTVKVNRQPEEI